MRGFSKAFCLVICLVSILVPVFASGRNTVISVTGFEKDGDVYGMDLGLRYIHDFDMGMSLSVDLNQFAPIIENGEIYTYEYETELNQDIVLGVMGRFDLSNIKIRLGGGLDLYMLYGEMGESEYKSNQLHIGLSAMADIQLTLWRHFAICLNGGVSYFFAGFADSKPYRGDAYNHILDVNRFKFTASVGLGGTF